MPLLASALGTALALRYARSRSLVDAPGDRRSHTQPTPRGGGIALVTVLVVSAVILAVSGGADTPYWAAIALGLTLVGSIGWWDDHRPLSAVLRLVVHGVAGAVMSLGLLASGAEWDQAVACGVIAVVLVNVWNFMDGIDGIATTQFVLVAAGSWWLWHGAAGIFAAACIAAGLGFLPYNFPRARIFLGDVGSGGMGFALAALAGAAVLSHEVQPAAALVLASAFLIDAGLTLARRIIRGEAWWTAHVQHAYQVWARSVASHRRVTVAFACWTLAGGGIGAWIVEASPRFIGAFAAAWYTSGALLWWYLQARYARHRLPHAADSRNG